MGGGSKSTYVCEWHIKNGKDDYFSMMNLYDTGGGFARLKQWTKTTKELLPSLLVHLPSE